MTRPSSSPDRDPRRYWLHPMLRIVSRSDAEIKRLLSKAAAAAYSDVLRLSKSDKDGKIVRRGQLSSAYRALRKTMGNLFADVYDTIKADRLDAMFAALLSSYQWEDPYYRAAGIPKSTRDYLRKSSQAMSDRRVELMLRRFNTEQIPLSKQVYRTRALAQKWVDNTINIGIGRGLTSRELAKEVREHIDPDVRGGVSYAAQRLARTEINNAFHTAAIVSNMDKPWVLGMQWRLSGSHPAEDICDELSKEDKFDLGMGIYPAGKTPKKPHPQCMCYVAPSLQDEDEFVAAFARGEYTNHFG